MIGRPGSTLWLLGHEMRLAWRTTVGGRRFRVRVVGLSVHLSRTPPTVRCSPPILGSDTKEILAELGLSGLPTADSTPRHQPETAAG